MNAVLFISVCCIFAAYIPKCRGDCHPLAGTETMISCTDYNSTRSAAGLYWRAEVDGKIMTVATCIAPGACNSLDKDIFEASLEDGTSNLTIKGVSRSHPFNMETRWFCSYLKDGYNHTACSHMIVMEKAKTPTCGPLTLNHTDWQLSVTCWTQHVYPQAKCQLYVSKYEYELRDISQWDSTFVSEARAYDHTEMTESLAYYRTECLFLLRLDVMNDFGAFYRVAMYPGVATTNNAVTYTDIMKINLALTDEGKDNADDDDDKVSVPVIALAAALGVAVMAVMVLAIVVCKSRQTKVKKPKRLTWSTETTETDVTSGRLAMARDTFQIRRSTTVSSTQSASVRKHYDEVNEIAENKGYVEEEEVYEELQDQSTPADAPAVEAQTDEVYEN